jgi:endonuclease/exonuclease/phosphatase family metal-dependent hydrolase
MFTEILGFGCATATRVGGYRDLKTYPSFSPTGSLDKIFFRGTVRLVRSRRCRLALSRIASDHLPILADFHVVEGP